MTITRAAIAGGVGILLAFASPAFAEPPPSGWYGGFKYPAPNCDTQEQIEAIVNAGVIKPKGGAMEEFNRLNATPGKYGPACQAGLPGTVVVGEVIPLGKFMSPTGPALAWALHVGNPKNDWWFLYVEIDKDEPGSNI